MNSFHLLAQQNEGNPVVGLLFIAAVCWMCWLVSRPKKPRGYTIAGTSRTTITPHR